jgi:N-acetylmuramoyl-L-alanine amidase
MIDQAKQVDLLSLAVWHEARGEPREGKSLVAATVLERVRDRRWPDTVEGVLSQGSQFFGLDLSESPHTWAPGWDECVDAAWEALRSASPAPANHFHATYVTPDWHDPAKVVKRSGGHVFLRL